MYGAYHRGTGSYIAFHEDFDVVDEYILSLENPEEYIAVKIKNKKFDKFVEGADLYLFEHKGRYIPYKYYEAASFFYDQDDYDIKHAISVLQSIQELDPELTKKDLKALIRVIELLKDRQSEGTQHTVSPKILEEMKLDYDLYEGEIRYKNNKW